MMETASAEAEHATRRSTDQYTPEPYSPLQSPMLRSKDDGRGARRSTESRRSMDARLNLANAPSPESVVKDSKGQKIEKLCGLGEWEPRFLCVTNDKFVIMHSENDKEIADQIPLVFSCFPNATMKSTFDNKDCNFPARDRLVGSHLWGSRCQCRVYRKLVHTVLDN